MHYDVIQKYMPANNLRAYITHFVHKNSTTQVQVSCKSVVIEIQQYLILPDLFLLLPAEKLCKDTDNVRCGEHRFHMQVAPMTLVFILRY